MQIKITLFFLILSVSLFAQKNFVNTAHLDHLYEEKLTGNDTIGVIHIYSEAPDYLWVGDDDEGFACIDDAARASVFYMEYYSQNPKPEYLNKIKKLLNFNLYMQAENGFFYNFIWENLSINKDFKTSVAEPNWWTWRAIWALSEGALFYKDKDKEFSAKLLQAVKRTIDVSLPLFKDKKELKEFGGYKLPSMFPYETAYDQGAVIIKSFVNYYKITEDKNVREAILILCNALLKTQYGDSKTPPYSAFLSWQNTWHAWGNSQADALLMAGKLFNKKEYIKAAEKEIKNFYPFLMKNNFFNALTFEKNTIKDSTKFSQIAYGIRPMVFASLLAYEASKDKKYLDIAVKSAMWLFGSNPAKKKIYDTATGRTFDGINDYESINKNSGAESTIESLLLLNRIEKNRDAKKKLLELTGH